MSYKRLFAALLLALSVSVVNAQTEVSAAPDPDKEAKQEKKGFNATEVIFGHISDSHEWHLFSTRHADGTESPVSLPLPVIIYAPGKGLSVFSAAHFENFHEVEAGDKKIRVSDSYNGYHLERGMKEKLVADDGSKVYDFSLTKNILSMLVGVVLLLWLMMAAAKKYTAKGTMTAPSGFQNFLEVVIIFMRDEVVKPNLGRNYKRYMPLILTIFFFIWINNMLGLLPGGANFTGNITVTLCLAIVSFIVMMAKSNKHFWGHLFNPPNVPLGIKFLLVPIEIMSMFIKPIALTIRLFANMLAGHIVILSVISMIFIFGTLNKWIGVGFVPVSLAFSVFMFMLELLVAAIQAFIFANLTAVFIGQAIEENHSNETGQEYHVNENEIIA
ncbi:MAG: F0F1 ATP synthase subunit A [Taibaiella sp.]|nr:F0F1 ATP synthase subunit A [Taibaiella sp.]